jgi:acyl-CoA thioesterase FadM
VTVPCRFTDIDASGAVGHIGLARYHEDARAAFIRSLIKSRGQASSQWRALLCRISTDVVAPARYPDAIRLAAGIFHVGERSYGVEVAVFQNGQPLSRARSLGVAVDADHKKILLADEVREVLTAAQLPVRWSFSDKPEAHRQDLGSYPHRLQLATRFSDVDIMAHINNVAMLRYCEEGRVELLRSSNRQRGTVIHTDISYLREGRFMDDMIIGTAVESDDGGRLCLLQGLFQRQECVATCNLIVTAA